MSDSQQWQATHVLSLPSGVRLSVMYDQHDEGDPAYTKQEWDSLDLAAVDRDGDGKWWIGGKPFTGKVRKIGRRRAAR